MNLEAPEPVAPSTQTQGPAGFFRTCFPTTPVLLAAVLICVLIPSSLIAIHIRENPRLSPIDETAQFDYVSRMASGSIPRLGQFQLPSSLSVQSCIGEAFSYTADPKCPGSRNPADYPGGAYQYEAQQPPTYYAVTVPIRWVGVHVLGLDSLDAARIGGVLWLSIGLLLLWITGMLLKIPIRILAPGILLLAAGPSVIYQGAIVSNDAPSIFAGALMAMLGVLAWQRPGRWTMPTLFGAAFVVAFIKLSDTLAILVVAAVLGVCAWTAVHVEGNRLRATAAQWLRRWGRSGGMLILGGGISALAWILISRKLSLIDPKNLPSFQILRTVPVGLWLIVRESLTMFNPLSDSFHPFRTNALGAPVGPLLNLQAITAELTEFLLIGAGLSAIFVSPRKWPHWLGLLSLAVLFAGGIVLGVGVWKTYGADPSISGRYGLSVAPLLVLALVGALRGRVATIGLWVFSVGVLGLTYGYLLTG
jgi:hypothetical protein